MYLQSLKHCAIRYKQVIVQSLAEVERPTQSFCEIHY